MAEPQIKDDGVEDLKKSKIEVFVDEALPDILVVTYEFGVKIFKGVLLDSTKRNLPCGVPYLNPAFTTPIKNPDDDPLYSVNQRFVYADPNAPKKKNVVVPRKYKNSKMSKMTVRLRPRQVLCSKCKGICNENSENVSRKTRSSEGTQNVSPPPPISKRGSNAPITRSVKYNIITSNSNVRLGNKRKMRGAETEDMPTMVPKIVRLTQAEEEAIANGTYVDQTSTTKRPLSSSSNWENTKETSKKNYSDYSDSDSSDTVSTGNPSSKAAKRAQRKKRSVGSMEDLWDETVFEENKGKTNSITGEKAASSGAADSQQNYDPPINSNSVTTNTRTIKISYGPQGEGTVLKIPAQIDSIDQTDSEENVNISELTTKKDPAKKAVRKALKKAKKEARRKVLLGGSPMYLGSTSPRYSLTSPRYTVGNASPRQGLGSNSPRYMMPPFDITVPRRRKHKMKHKKKHREDKDRRHKEGEVSSTQDDTKEQCMTQKLSINLKRLNNTYTPCPPMQYEDTSSSDEHSEQVPDFPSPNPPLMLRINAQTVSSAIGADGGRLLIGDVVWGKVHGFPWWPAKILAIASYGAGGAPSGSGGNAAASVAGQPYAHVAWYGSTTSSLMQCDQLSHYLPNFKIHYNKKRKGPYKEAIKQATMDAHENAENRVRQPLGNSPSHNIMPQVVSPALASPREIDVMS